MSTTAWIIIVVIAVIVVAIFAGMWKRRRDQELETRRTVATAHRENAQVSQQRAAEAQAQADRLAADAARERATAGASLRQAEGIDPDATADEDAGQQESPTSDQQAGSSGAWR